MAVLFGAFAGCKPAQTLAISQGEAVDINPKAGKITKRKAKPAELGAMQQIDEIKMTK